MKHRTGRTTEGDAAYAVALCILLLFVVAYFADAIDGPGQEPWFLETDTIGGHY